MVTYSLDLNRKRPYKVIDITDEVGMEGVYSGSYDDCVAYIEEAATCGAEFGMDIIPNPYWNN